MLPITQESSPVTGTEVSRHGGQEQKMPRRPLNSDHASVLVFQRWLMQTRRKPHRDFQCSLLHHPPGRPPCGKEGSP